jgi:hypothetical protein
MTSPPAGKSNNYNRREPSYARMAFLFITLLLAIASISIVFVHWFATSSRWSCPKPRFLDHTDCLAKEDVSGRKRNWAIRSAIGYTDGDRVEDWASRQLNPSAKSRKGGVNPPHGCPGSSPK